DQFQFAAACFAERLHGLEAGAVEAIQACRAAQVREHHPERARVLEEAEGAAAGLIECLQRREAAVVPEIDLRAVDVIRVREEMLRACTGERGERPVIAPATVERLERDEAFAVPFEQTRFA